MHISYRAYISLDIHSLYCDFRGIQPFPATDDDISDIRNLNFAQIEAQLKIILQHFSQSSKKIDIFRIFFKKGIDKSIIL